MDVVINGFSTLAEAEQFFTNNIKPSQTLDGILFKTGGHFTYFKSNVPTHELNPDRAEFAVISYPRGTGIAIDAGTPAAPAPAADADDEEPAADPGDAPDAAPDDITGPEI